MIDRVVPLGIVGPYGRHTIECRLDRRFDQVIGAGNVHLIGLGGDRGQRGLQQHDDGHHGRNTAGGHHGDQDAGFRTYVPAPQTPIDQATQTHNDGDRSSYTPHLAIEGGDDLEFTAKR